MYLSIDVNKFNLASFTGSFHKVVTRYHTFHADDVTHIIVKRGLHESDHPYNKIKEVKFSTLGR